MLAKKKKKKKKRVLKLKKFVVEKLFAEAASCEDDPAAASISYIYEITTHNSGLRNMLVDRYTGRNSSVRFQKVQMQALLRQSA